MREAGAGPVEGYRDVEPRVTITGDSAVIESADVHYRPLNEAIRGVVADGATTVVLQQVNGQRYLGAALKGASLRIEAQGTAGNDLAMFLDGPTIEVFGAAQDGVGNTMNAGTVIVHGHAGDVLGYGMRGGRIFVKGDVGYRVGIHMKSYEGNVPVMVCGGKARDFFGEYMAGGVLVLLGMNSRTDGPIVGSFVGTGMHGGVIYLRGEVEAWQCGKEVGVFSATEEDLNGIRPVLEEYCEAFGVDCDEVFSEPFTKLVPTSHRPYGKLYTYL